jgi:hypothetical protein
MSVCFSRKNCYLNQYQQPENYFIQKSVAFRHKTRFEKDCFENKNEEQVKNPSGPNESILRINNIQVTIARYIYVMIDNKYRILQVLYEIVKDKTQPLQYHCGIREILLRLKGNWQPEYLEELVREELIVMKKSTNVVILITQKGLEKAKIVFANLR